MISGKINMINIGAKVAINKYNADYQTMTMKYIVHRHFV